MQQLKELHVQQGPLYRQTPGKISLVEAHPIF